MRPPIDATAISSLRAGLPEFEDQYLDLVSLYGEDLTPEIVLMGLADFVAHLMVARDREDVLERCFALVDELGAGGGGGALVAHCFLGELPLGSRTLARTYFGPVTARLAGEGYEEGIVDDVP